LRQIGEIGRVEPALRRGIVGEGRRDLNGGVGHFHDAQLDDPWFTSP
jgi:hypothetical protein